MQMLSGVHPDNKNDDNAEDEEQSDHDADLDSDAETPSAIFQGGGLR